jgi:hypothetical protein
VKGKEGREGRREGGTVCCVGSVSRKEGNRSCCDRSPVGAFYALSCHAIEFSITL